MNRYVKKILFGTVHGAGSVLHPSKQRPLPSSDSVHSILIAALHGLGDVLYMSSVLPMLKELYPAVEIDVWVHSRAAEVLKYNPFVHKQFVYDEIVTRRDTERFRLDRENRKKFNRELRDVHYDIIVDCSWVWGATLTLHSAHARYFAGASQHGLGFLFDRQYPYEAISHLPLRDLYAKFFHKLGIIPEDVSQPSPIFYMSETAKTDALRLLKAKGILFDKPLFSLHTTAGWKEKEWNIDRYAKLVQELINRYSANIVTIGNGRRDREGFDRLRAHCPEIKDALDLPLDMTAGVMTNCSVHIGGDSFPLHLAAALNVPAVCLAGPTNPELFAPPKEKHAEILYHRLYCSAPDGERYCTRNAGRTCPTIDCLNDMEVSEVLSAVGNVLDGANIRTGV